MGKIKNREQKRSQARIFASGAAGCGNSGPQPDKRDLQYPCPHCERVFKQSGRLKEHISRHHGDASPQEAAPSVAKHASDSVQDVGSGHGYYTHKSPKLLLLEWCQKHSRRKPIYKIFTDSVGRPQCKVVLPDTKDAKKDVVVFLDREFAADVADDERAQFGATAALCRVAGDCAFHRILPQQYRPVWDHCKRSYDERREKEAPPAPEKRIEREPQSIVMSRAKQEILDKTLKRIYPPPEAQGFVVRQEWARLEQRLLRDGFSRRRISQAMQQALHRPTGTFAESVLDWLCFYLDDSEFPEAFSKRSKTQMVEVVKPSVEESFDEEDGDRDEIEDPHVEGLLKYGYALPDVLHALEICQSDPESAQRALYERLTGVCLGKRREDDGVEDGWGEECEGLRAIYDRRCRILGPDSVELDLDVPEELTACTHPSVWKQAPSIDGERICLFVGEVGSEYPSAVPLIAVSCPSMRVAFLRYLTSKLAEKSTEFTEMPMVHSLIDALMDLLTEAAQPHFELPQASVKRPELEVRDISDEEEAAKDSGLVEVPAVQAKGAAKPAVGQYSPEELLRDQADLKARQEKLQSCQVTPEAYRSRSSLPAASFAPQIVEGVQGHAVAVVTGLPGCGKSTQVPQFLLEHAVSEGHGGSCHIICTQPRRISATSLAARVAAERGESVGDVVGFSVRNHHSHSRRTHILYCTTGILLRRFVSDGSLVGVSHVLIDEVHERTVEMDLLLLLLKKLLQKSRRDRHKVQCPKIVLMSATANALDFQKYFSQLVGDVPILHIPGFTYPVRTFLLEDVHMALESLQARRCKSGWETESSGEENEHTCRPLRPSAKKKKGEELQVDYAIIEHLVGYVISEEHERGPGFLTRNWVGATVEAPNRKEDGAILIFLPGTAEIQQMVRILRSTPTIPSFKEVRVLPLHASLPAAEQRRVFEDVGPDVRKIIVSTNVAETSVTIPDVTVVIDSCLAKEVGCDAERRISRLKVQWISKAASKQRAGRSGRVQCGACFRLVTSERWEQMRDETPPEIVRTPLQSFCLTVLSLVGKRGGPLAAHLRECITAPAPSQIDAAMATLREVGAIDDDEKLTPLGAHLMKMPMDVHVGKMLIYGALLKCVGSVLTLASALTYGRPLFLCPQEKQLEANAAKRTLYATYQNAKSDHMAIVAAIEAFRQSGLHSGSPLAGILATFFGLAGGSAKAVEFCRERFLSAEALFAILDGRLEYARVLADLGFVPQSYVRELDRPTLGEELPACDVFATQSRFVRAAVCAGFYPNLVRVKHPPKKYVATQGGSKEVDADAKQLKLYDRERGRVFLHPASVNFKVQRFESEWLVYSDMIETGKIYVRQCSMVPVYAMLVFSGGHVLLNHREGVLLLPSWKAAFQVHPKVGVMIKLLRKEVENVLAERILRPEDSGVEHPVVSAIMSLLETDGF